MTREELEARYQLVEQVTEGDVRTHHAVAAGGTVVMVHFVRPGTPRGDAVLERVGTLGEEEAARVLRRHEVEGEVVLVTRFLMDEGSLERWLGLDDQHPAERSATEPQSGAGEGAVEERDPPKQSDPEFGDVGASSDSGEDGPGEFTRMFKRMDSPDAPPETPLEQDEEPGEFTRLFKAMEDPARSRSETDSRSATPSAESRTAGGPAGEAGAPESAEEGVGERGEDPKPQGPSPDPGEKGGGGEFTRLFQAIRPGPGEEEPGPPPAEPPSRPRPPAASGPPGSFTQEFGRVARPGEEDAEPSPPSSPSPRPPAPPSPPRQPSDTPPPPRMPDYRSPSPEGRGESPSEEGSSSEGREPDDYLDRLQSFGPPEGGGSQPPAPPRPPAPGGQGPPPPPSRSGEAGSRGAPPSPPGAGGGRAGPSEFTRVISAVSRGGGGPQAPRPPASPARPSAPSTGVPGGSGGDGGKGPSNVLLLVGIVVVFLLALAVILVFALMGGNGEGEAEPEAEEATDQVEEVDAAASTVRPQAHLHFSGTGPLPPEGG